MSSFTASDFLSVDIGITKIDNVWYQCDTNWAKPQKSERICHGLLYFISGGIEYDFGSFGFSALPGQVVRLPAGIPYSGRKLEYGVNRYYCINFYTEPSEDYTALPFPYSYTPSGALDAESAFAEIEERWRSASLCSKLECKYLTLQLLASLIKDFATNDCHYDDRSRIIRYCEYLRGNFHRQNLRVSELAGHFHVSETHLRRIFASELGCSPAAYLAQIRVDSAKRLLCERPDYSISQVSDACGYSSVYYFSSVFHEVVGCSPSRYREEMKKLNF